MAQPTDKQFDALLGISRKMEQSLEGIEKALAAGNAAGVNAGRSGAVNNLASMATSINIIIKSLFFKKLNKQNSDTVLKFIEGVVTTVSSITPKKLDSLANFATGISNFIETLSKISLVGIAKIALLGKVMFHGKNPLLKRIIEGASNSIKHITGKDADKLQKTGAGIFLLADGLKTLAKALGYLALVAIAAPLIILGAATARLVVGMFVSIGKRGGDIKKGGAGIKMLGKGLMNLALGLAVLALVTKIIDAQTVMEIIGVVAALSLTFFIIGKGSKEIHKGSKVVKEMGLSLVSLGLGIAFLSLVLLIVPPKILLAGMFVLIGYALVFGLIGKASKNIAEGALAIILGIAVGLFFLAGGLLIFFEALNRIKIENALLGIAVIGILAALFTEIGFAGPFIEDGALAVGAIGAALIVFSLGLIIYSLALKGVIAMFKNDWEIAALATVGIIVGLAGIFSLLGVLSPAIALGSVALALMGASLIVFSLGLILYSLVLKGVMGIFKNDWEKAKEGTKQIMFGLAKAFSLIGLLIVPIALGSAALGLMGVALMAFSGGLLLFSLAVKAVMKMDLYDERKKEFKGTSILKAIAKGISSLAWYLIPVALGTPVAAMLGVSLIMISTGLMAAAKALKPINEMGVKTFTEALFSEERGIIPAVARGFKKIYKDFGGGGFLGALRTLTGTDPVSMGIRIVKGMGAALEDVAGGIAAYANFDRFPIKVPNKKGDKLVYDTINLFDTVDKISEILIGGGNIKDGFLYSIADVFGKIGQAYPTGNFWEGDGDVKAGIKSVRGIGDALQSIAGGIVAFSNFEKFPIQVVDEKDKTKLIYDTVNLFTIPDKITSTLLGDGTPEGNGFLFTLAKVFGTIGKQYPSGFLKGKSKVRKGADAVKEMGDAIAGIAAGIVAFADSKAIPDEFDPITGKPTHFTKLNMDMIIGNITRVVTAIPTIFASIDEDVLDDAKDRAKGYKKITEAFENLGSAFKRVKDAFFIKGDEGKDQGMLSLLSTEITNFTNAMAKPINMDSMVNLGLLASMFEKFGAQADPFKDFAAAFERFNKSFGSFAGNMALFAKNFKLFTPQLKVYEKFAALLNGQAYYGPRFAIFEDSFRRMASDLRPFSENFKLMDDKTIQAFRFWTEALTSFVKISPDTFKSVADEVAKLKDVLPRDKEETTENKPENQPSRLLGGIFNTPSVAPSQQVTQSKTQEPVNSGMSKQIEDLTIAISQLMTALSPLKDLNTQGGKLHVTME